MSYATLRTSIESRFGTNWNYTPVSWPNKSFDPAEKKDVGTFEINEPWVRLAINTGLSEQASLEENPLKRVIGVIAIQIFTKTNTGTGLSDTYADNVEAIFGDQSFGNVVCRSTTKTTVGKTGDWYQVNAVTPFTYDYT